MELNNILNDVKYESYCKYVSNYSSTWEDLYQEFRIKVFIEFNKIKADMNPVAYCMTIINNIWRDCNGYRPSHKNAMLLANYADKSYEVTDYIYNEIDTETIDIMPELDLLLKTENSNKRKKAEIFKNVIEGKNKLQTSKELGINYRIVHDAVRETAETIKYNMTKNEIKSALLAQGISSNYSGKTKTFFTNKKPSPDLEKSIIAVGFKIQTK